MGSRLVYPLALARSHQVDEQRNYAMRSTAQTTASRSTPRTFIHSARTENFVARQKGFVATEKSDSASRTTAPPPQTHVTAMRLRVALSSRVT
jgi:hypothetical protein